MNSATAFSCPMAVIISQLAWADDLTATHRTAFAITGLVLLMLLVLLSSKETSR